ncbi:hypothetical protein CONPUDRAFT_145861 [Coniophora puteana RWD-64-598 SS2]|uniref:F-box domain-containing protein n=1 Tax=Coniophora puteana (strain RWD-64-598) TaxID=741705 RepID=A0A5M3MFX8_CONPW|nr:uncharacterized protein CONPUDRAFT_145861 [Coniophora puteana RWD-64-598 SS2]EIW77501.1 hypothetical protein CONPUDRAFT_145861 [Coniophora puteana RWD-64-598 SS2]
MEFKWSTPTRRSPTGQDLPIIPNEIYIAILESFVPSSRFPKTSEIRTLRSFAVACRFFCHLALPRMFERLLFDGSGDPRKMGAFNSGGWAHAVITGKPPALTTAAFVKCVVFQNWTDDALGTHIPMRGWLSHLVGFHCQALEAMPNLEAVVFSRADVTVDHVRALRNLQKLRVLEFRGRNTWDVAKLENDDDAYGDGGLGDPRAEGGFGAYIERVVIDDEIEEEDVDGDQYTSLPLPDWGSKALAACPKLRSLVLDSIDMLVTLGNCLKVEAAIQGEASVTTVDGSAPLATRKVLDLELNLPLVYGGREERYVLDVFTSGGAWALSYLSIESLRIVVPPQYAKQVFVDHGVQTIVEAITKTATARLLKLVRLEILTLGHTFAGPKRLDMETLTTLASDICPRLERLYFGGMTWTIKRE